jgi:hypothetical protein
VRLVRVIVPVVLFLAGGARADYLDSTGIPNFIDEAVDHSTWHCPIPTATGECDLAWEVATTYDLRFECEGSTIPGEMGTLHMNHGKFALESLSGRRDSGTYRIVSRHLMYIWGANGPSTWTDRPRKLADHSIPPPGAEPPANVVEPPDSRLVGTWVGYVNATGGKFDCQLDIAANGRYAWQFKGSKGSYTQVGQLEATKGRWEIHPDNDDYDHGNYALGWDQAGNKPVLTMSSAPGSRLSSIIWVNKVQ